MSFMAIISHVVIFTRETESACTSRCIRPKKCASKIFLNLRKENKTLVSKALEYVVKVPIKLVVLSC